MHQRKFLFGCRMKFDFSVTGNVSEEIFIHPAEGARGWMGLQWGQRDILHKPQFLLGNPGYDPGVLPIRPYGVDLISPGKCVPAARPTINFGGLLDAI